MPCSRRSASVARSLRTRATQLAAAPCCAKRNAARRPATPQQRPRSATGHGALSIPRRHVPHARARPGSHGWETRASCMSGGDGEPRGGALGRRACGGAHLAAEHAHELLVLADLHLLHLLTQRGTVPGAVLARDSHLLRVLALRCCSGARSEQWRATRSACPERRVFAEVRVRRPPGLHEDVKHARCEPNRPRAPEYSLISRPSRVLLAIPPASVIRGAAAWWWTANVR